jgi:hypothetical protein
MANARPFSIFKLQDLSNDTKNPPMRGVLGLAVELSTFGSLRGLQILTFSKCWASPPHLAKVGLRQIHLLPIKLHISLVLNYIIYLHKFLIYNIVRCQFKNLKKRNNFRNCISLVRTWFIIREVRVWMIHFHTKLIIHIKNASLFDSCPFPLL